MTAASTPAQPQQTKEEPEITQEESVPSDGPDTEGEEMMKDVRNPKLEKPDETAKKKP